jgi:two-component system OmpR family sensor kinase
MRRVTRFIRSRLHRRLFLWFGLSIVLTGAAMGFVMHTVGGGEFGWKKTMDRGRTFLASQYREVWNDPVRRSALTNSIARDLQMGVVVEDANGNLIEAAGPCHKKDIHTRVANGAETLGMVHVCTPRGPRGGWLVFYVLGVGFLMLWGTSGVIARRLVKPLGEVARVANEIGNGNLKTRVTLRRNKVGEIAELADRVNHMADRIERQMADQRELLAAVSHEIRSPLARLRVLVDLARDGGTSEKVAGDIEREVVEIDSLVGQLLASSRLDFEAIEHKRFDVGETARRSLERVGLSEELLQTGADPAVVHGDPTLVARALLNLLDNAKKHAHGVSALVIEQKKGEIILAVDDDGPGFTDGDLPKVFETFVRGERSAGSSLGLGLSLVQRIARAHGGRAWAENRPQGGARVAFSLSV